MSEFVEALKTELESTFKEEISVYFDINPHDGLLETHDVDASLKEKLKCLIFIPVISRTTSIRYKNTNLSLKETARELNVSTHSMYQKSCFMINSRWN